MKTGMGLGLIAIGAILAFAVTTNTSVFARRRGKPWSPGRGE
jgi:hypothetical protein